MRIACWITKATNTYSEYLPLTAFPRQQWLRERALALRYTHIASVVQNCVSLKLLKSWSVCNFGQGCTNFGRVNSVMCCLMYVGPENGTCFVVLLAPRVLKQLLDYCKICASLIWQRCQTVKTTSDCVVKCVINTLNPSVDVDVVCVVQRLTRIRRSHRYWQL